MRTRRTTTLRRRSKWLWSLLLCLALSLVLMGSAMAREVHQAQVVDPATIQPVVTIQGNLVVDDSNRPTGFYELGLSVRSGRTVVDTYGLTGVTPGTAIDDTTYETYINNNPADEDKFAVTYYPFRTVSAAMTVNTRVLTPVNWDVQKVTYGDYAVLDAYPYGIDTDPEVQGYEGLTREEAFPDITTAYYHNAVDIDVEADSRILNAVGRAERYDEDSDTALITLAAHAPDNAPVVLKKDTLLVVARFAYDLKTYSITQINEDDLSGDLANRNAITGDLDDMGLWMGWDKTSGLATSGLGAKTPLVWMGESEGLYNFDDSDDLVQRTSSGQSVWVHMGTNSGTVTDDDTYFYYYLGAEMDQMAAGSPGSIDVDLGGNTPAEVKYVSIPRTVGQTVLTEGTAQNPAPDGSDPAWTATAPYTYFGNLLRLKDKTLVIEMVNHTTFKKPTGGTGGNQILFYDWDDTLIGALIVGDGDVRAQVNDYVEKNMVHPDLRTADLLAGAELGGQLPDYNNDPITAGSDAEKYQNIANSLEREWTYRGKYSSKVDGSGVSYTEDTGDAAYDATKVGKEYPLTNKLDYAFYRHLDTVTTLEYVKGTTTVTDRYVTTAAVTSDADAALYPWVYGWAVVEDNSAINTSQWTVRRDAAKVEDVWTTMGVGELSSTSTTAALQNIPAAIPGGTTPVSGTGIQVNYPAFVDTTAVTDPTQYNYKLSSADANGYLRFADFSDMAGQLTKDGQNVLVVKAVYEPGPELLSSGQYTILEKPYYSKQNTRAADDGGAYSVELTLERANNSTGNVVGVGRMRMPAVRQDTTLDQKWIVDELLNVDHNLDNPSLSIAKLLTETIYTKVDTDNGEQIQFTLTLSARQNKVDYWLVETYGNNFVSGGQRTRTNYSTYGENHVLDNYSYFRAEDEAENDTYFDKPNFYYQAVRFDVRNGTSGYVLHGTLNYLMQQATQTNRGELTADQFRNIYAINAVLADANLRIDAASPGTAYMLAPLLTAAAADCEANKTSTSVVNGKTVWDYWDPEHDCAQLTYHQLQYYVINGALIPRSVSEDLSQTHFDWCHLHIDCFDDKEAEVLPANWSQLIDAARSDGGFEPTQIGKILLDKLKDLTYLRTNASGGNFATSAALQTAIVDAVNALDGASVPVTWTTVQYYIINNAPPSDESAANTAAQANYWWYDGAASRITPSSPTALATAADDFFNVVTLKDGKTFTGGFTAKLGGVEGVFNANAAAVAATGKVTDDWKRMTHNPVKAYENYDGESYGDLDGTGATTPFDDYDEFINYWLNFQTVARAAGLPSSHDRLWEFWQYYVLQSEAGAAPTAAELQQMMADLDAGSGLGYDAVVAEFNSYWWKDGNKRLVVSSISTLLKAARQVNDGGDSGPLDKVDMALLESLYLRGSKTGQTFAELGMSRDDVIDLVKDAAALYRVDGDPTSGYLITNWSTLQYYINRGKDGATTTEMNAEAGYYWWANGADGTEVDITGSEDVNTRIIMLLNALIRSTYYGDPKALNQLTDPAQIYSDLALLQTYPGANITLGEDGLPNMSVDETLRQALEFTSMQDFITALTDALAKAQTAESITKDYERPSIDWWQVQYALLNGGDYIPYSPSKTSQYYKAYTEYWWYEADTYEYDSGPEVPEWHPEPTDALFSAMATYIETTNKNTAAKNALKAAIVDETFANTVLKLRTSKTGSTQWTSSTVKKLQTILVDFATNAAAATDGNGEPRFYKDWDGDGTKEFRFTWAQFQVYVVTCTATSSSVSVSGDLLSPAEALDLITSNWKWTVEGVGKNKAYIPADVDMSVLTSGTSLAADQLMIVDLAGEAAEAAQPAPTPAEPSEAEQIAALEAQIAALQKQLDALKGAQPETTETVTQTTATEVFIAEDGAVTTTTTTVTTTVTTTTTVTVTPPPAKTEGESQAEAAPAAEEEPTADRGSHRPPADAANHDERPETPQGEEAQAAASAAAPAVPAATVSLGGTPLLFAVGYTYYNNKKRRR